MVLSISIRSYLILLCFYIVFYLICNSDNRFNQELQHIYKIIIGIFIISSRLLSTMIHLAYIILGYILLFEVVVFLLLTLPTPQGFKGRVVRALLGSKLMSILMWVHLGLCIIAAMFYAELMQT